MSKNLSAVSRIYRKATGQEELGVVDETTELDDVVEDEPKPKTRKRAKKKVEETTVVVEDE